MRHTFKEGSTGHMLERGNPKPLYAQLADILRRKIENEEWMPNEAIPSENELSREYGVSRMTARGVVSELAREGLLYRVQGKGTYVSEPKITTSSLTYMGISEQLAKMGYKTSTRVLECVRNACPPKIAKILELPERADAFIIRRLRYLKDTPLSIHTSYIPARRCAGLVDKDLEQEQLCDILDREYGLKRRKVVETLESAIAGDAEARLLAVKKGYPLLFLTDVVHSDDGVPFEYTEIVLRGDKIKIGIQYDTNTPE